MISITQVNSFVILEYKTNKKTVYLLTMGDNVHRFIVIIKQAVQTSPDISQWTISSMHIRVELQMLWHILPLEQVNGCGLLKLLLLAVILFDVIGFIIRTNYRFTFFVHFVKIFYHTLFFSSIEKVIYCCFATFQAFLLLFFKYIGDTFFGTIKSK